MKFFILLFLLSLSACSQEPQISTDVESKAESIKKYAPIEGEWVGNFFIKNAPDELLKIMAKNGSDKSGIGIKVILKDNVSEVYFKFTPKTDWEKSDATIQIVTDKLAWHMYLIRAEDIWLERIFLSVARTKENTGALTVTRTVHNWYHTENSAFPEYYYTFGAGELKKI
jgi:hypothetical protein